MSKLITQKEAALILGVTKMAVDRMTYKNTSHKEPLLDRFEIAPRKPRYALDQVLMLKSLRDAGPLTRYRNLDPDKPVLTSKPAKKVKRKYVVMYQAVVQSGNSDKAFNVLPTAWPTKKEASAVLPAPLIGYRKVRVYLKEGGE